jgi:hypothetical protein
MSKLYLNESGIKLSISVEKDVSEASALRLAYKKPSGTTGAWGATISTEDVSRIEYKLQSGNLDETGRYAMWAEVDFIDGSTMIGEAFYVSVLEPGR